MFLLYQSLVAELHGVEFMNDSCEDFKRRGEGLKKKEHEGAGEDLQRGITTKCVVQLPVEPSANCAFLQILRHEKKSLSYCYFLTSCVFGSLLVISD